MRVALIKNHRVELVAAVEPESLDQMRDAWCAIYDTIVPLRDDETVNPGDTYIYIPNV